MDIWPRLPCSPSDFPSAGSPSASNRSSIMATHILEDPEFWSHFQHQVQSRAWKCNFPSEIMFRDLEKDAQLYGDDTVLRKRRLGVLRWTKNDTQWTDLVLGACRERAEGREGARAAQLRELHLLEALDDFVEHLNCFYVVAEEMTSRGRPVKPLSQDSSRVHDIDKLDPVMLVGYSERFEDGRTTSVWSECVERHVRVNPHHQAHCLWHNKCCNETACIYCRDLMERALSEMVCDKVSRRLQKNLKGVVTDDMWDVDLAFFQGLPSVWLDKALEIMKSMKLAATGLR